MQLDNNVTVALNCLEEDGLQSNYFFIFLFSSCSIVLLLFIACSILCIYVTIAAFKAKHKITHEEHVKHVDEISTTEESTKFTENYFKLPDNLKITKGTNRKLSRLSSIAKSTKMKDSEDATNMLELIVSHQNVRGLSVS